MSALETRVPPVVWALLAIVLAWLVSSIADDALDAGWARPTAVVVAVLGVGMASAGIREFVRASTTVDPHRIDEASALVTGGVYRLTRNPMYVGLLSLVVAAGLWFGSIVGLVVGAVFLIAVLTRFQILPEERMLAERFGDDYQAFRARTRRWIW